MPIPLSRSQAAGGDTAERVPMLEREMGKLRRELETLKGRSSAEGSQGVHRDWITLGLAAFGVLLGLIAVLKH